LFWKPKSPLTADDEEWQIECWRWLIENFDGPEALRQRRLVEPTGEFFPSAKKQGHAQAEYVFELTAALMGLSPDWFELVPQEEAINPIVGQYAIVKNVPLSPAGTFGSDGSGGLSITYDPGLIARPMDLVATLAHELCHALLLQTKEKPPGGDECEEFATDLAVTFFGLGIFGANAAFNFSQFSDPSTGMQGWSTRRTGYLTDIEWGFSLALFALSTDTPDERIAGHLKVSPAAHFRKSLKYLRANPAIMERALSV
jgi:hypothetical protein